MAHIELLFLHDTSVAVAPSSSHSLGAYNRRKSGYGLSPSAQIGSLRSPTSDMRQPLEEV